jgi:hypothetical protein
VLLDAEVADGELHPIISAIIGTQLNETIRSPVQQILFTFAPLC